MCPEGHIFTPIYRANLELIMEERTSTPLSGDAMERKIDELLQAVRSADPAELESIKSLIRKKVKFFDRMSLAAILLKTVSEGRKREERAERKPRQEKKPIQPVPPEREEQKE